jgi:hypothetical protein
MSDPMLLDRSLHIYEKTKVIIILSRLQMVMKHAGYLTSLKYSQRYTDWKEETQRTISTQKLCRIYTKHLKKFTALWHILKEQSEMISLQSTWRVGCQILRKIVGHWSPSMFASTLQFSIAQLNEDGLEKWKTILTLRRTSTTGHEDSTHTGRDELGIKKSNLELFLKSVTSTENEEMENWWNERR